MCAPGAAHAQSRTLPPETALIHYGDLVDVDVVGSIEFDWRGGLTPEGFLDGFDKSDEPIYALCRSEDEVAADVARAYSKFLRDPRVVVRVLDRSDRAVAILYGAVKVPQRFRIKRSVRLSELLALSGGITDDSSGDIIVYRPEGVSCAARAERPANDQLERPAAPSAGSTYRIPIGSILAGETGADLPIFSGDIITVAEASPIFVMGAVGNPRAVASRADLRVTQAISMAGGAAKEARRGLVSVYRREAGETKVLEVDLGSTEPGSPGDILLKPYDVVDVGLKGMPKRRLADPAGWSRARDENPQRMPLRIIE